MLCYFIVNLATHITVPCGIFYWVQFMKSAKFEIVGDVKNFQIKIKKEKKLICIFLSKIKEKKFQSEEKRALSS